jgi:glycosyltransferase involved in cell wall biosynthesis
MTRSPRVLLLCDRLHAAGGVERFVCALANSLCRDGMRVAVGSPDAPRAAIPYPLDAEVRVLSGAPGRRVEAARDSASMLGRAFGILSTQWHIGRALLRLIREERPDVIVLNGLTTACSVLALDRSFAGRVICCDHNHFDARSSLWKTLRRWLYPKVGAVVSLTQADAPKFRALNPRTEVIYNASTLQADEPASPDGLLVLAVGRHVAQKGFDLLIEAWASVLRALPAARLEVLGDGPLRAQHEAMARSLGLEASIRFLASTGDVEGHYREASVFVLPSRYEGMPLALLEAQALGVPAVAFDCPTGPAEIVGADTGRLVPAGGTGALAAAIVELLSSADVRRAMGRAAIVRSRERFSAREHEQRWAALVRKVAAANAGVVAA